MLTQALPFFLHLLANAHRHTHLGAYSGRVLLADFWWFDFDHREVVDVQGHARPSTVNDLVAVVLPGLHLEHRLLDVLADLEGGLESKQVNVADQVVLQREKLQVQLRNGQTVLRVVVLRWHQVLIPDGLLGRIERQLVDLLDLRAERLEMIDEDLFDQLPAEAGKRLWVAVVQDERKLLQLFEIECLEEL